MKSTNLIVILSAILSLSACGKKKSDDKVTATPDALISNQWCTLESGEFDANTSIMTRYTFKKADEKNTARVEYIRITDEGKAVTYIQNKDYEWSTFKTDSDLSYRSFSVELKKDPDQSTSIRNQQYALKQISKNYPSLAGVTSESDFKPAYEISLKHLTFMSVDNSEQLFYPCNSFGKTFETTGEVHPIVEFQIYLGQLFSKAKLSDNFLASVRALKLPIKEINSSDLISKNDSWCAQFEYGSNWSELNVLTFANNKYLSTRLSDEWLSDPERHERVNTLIPIILERANVYSVLKNDQRLSGQSNVNSTIGDQTFKYDLNDLFVAVEDAEGTQALVKVSATNPENTGSIPFQDTFFKCSSEKKDNQYFQGNLKLLIEAQKNLLSK